MKKAYINKNSLFKMSNKDGLKTDEHSTETKF